MTQRGRKSSASLAVVPIGQPQRPEPPQGMPKEEAKVWRHTVGAMRADWFGAETHPLLAQYCRHVANATVISREIKRRLAAGNDIVDLDRLLAMHARESQALSSAATRLRLTPRSTRDKDTNRHLGVTQGPKPWEIKRVR